MDSENVVEHAIDSLRDTEARAVPSRERGPIGERRRASSRYAGSAMPVARLAAGGKILPPAAVRHGGGAPQRLDSHAAGTPLAYRLMSMRIAPKFRRWIQRAFAVGWLSRSCRWRQRCRGDPTLRTSRSSNRWRNPKLRCSFRRSPISSASWSARSNRSWHSTSADGRCAQLTSTHHMKDRATIELRCQDAKPWHLYVPVRIIGTSTVAVAAHAIVVGSVLKAADITVEEHDISELPLGFLDDPAIAVGLTASRPIPAAPSYQSATGGREGGAARPIGDVGGRCGRHERAHGGPGPERWPGKSTVKVKNCRLARSSRELPVPNKSWKLFCNSPSVIRVTVDNNGTGVVRRFVKVHPNPDDNPGMGRCCPRRFR